MSPLPVTVPTDPTPIQGEFFMSAAIKPSSALSIALAWLVVIVPAAWGVYNTALKAANLFK
jgi:hypothetical protein